MFQSLSLVKALAWTGSCEAEALRTCLGSLLRFEAPDIESIYGDIGHLKPGLEALSATIGSASGPPDREMAEYAIRLLHLEGKLRANGAVADQIREGLEAAERQAGHFDDIAHESVIGRIAMIYQDTISTLGPRVMVSGESMHLNNPDVAARIRALLLAGIRAAVLWRQAGGNRWRLLLQRKAILATCNELLAES